MCSINHLMQTDGCSENNMHPCCFAQRVVLRVLKGLHDKMKTSPLLRWWHWFPDIRITDTHHLDVPGAASSKERIRIYIHPCVSLSSCWGTATVRLSAVDPVADGELALTEDNVCQEPAEFTQERHNRLVSTPRCTAEACVSTLEIRVWSTKQCF